MPDRPTAQDWYMEERSRPALTPDQRIRCEALSNAVRMMPRNDPAASQGLRENFQEETLRLAERFEAWIRGESDA